LVHRQTVLVERHAVVAVARITLVAVATKQACVQARGRIPGVFELDLADLSAGRTRNGQPGILDQLFDRFGLLHLTPDSNDLDARDAAAFVGRTVALTGTDAIDSLGPQRLGHLVSATGKLRKRSRRANPELRGSLKLELTTHRHAFLTRIDEIEPKQDAVP